MKHGTFHACICSTHLICKHNAKQSLNDWESVTISSNMIPSTVSLSCRVVTYTPAVHVIPAEELGAAWHDFKSEALPSINTVVPLAVAAASHMTGGLGRGDGDGAGGGCERH